jgi:hypothetical protein
LKKEKAVRKSKSTADLARPVEELEFLTRRETRDFESFARQMRPKLSKMADSDREGLLTDLYRLAKSKKAIERWAEEERTAARKFREYRTSLVDAQRLLREAMEKILKVAEIYPRWTEFERLFSGEDIRMAIIEAGRQLAKAREIVASKQTLLAALINPKVRTALEKKLVKQEILSHGALPPSEKTKIIDLWFIREAALRLKNYRTVNGKPIPGDENVIAQLFRVAFKDETRTAESVRRYLARQRGESPRQLL